MEVITCADGALHLTAGLHNVVEMGKEKKEEKEKEEEEKKKEEEEKERKKKHCQRHNGPED